MMSYTIPLIKFVAFLDLLAVGLIVPLISNHVRQMGGSHICIGLLGSLYAGFQLGSGPFIGSLSDIRGRKQILLLTLLVCSATYMILGLTNSIAIILTTRAVLGLFKQTQLLTKALVPDYEKDEKKQSTIYGKMAAISGVGITLGPVIGGHIAEDHSVNGFGFIGIAVGIFFLINAGFVSLLPNVTPDKIKKNDLNSSRNSLQILLNSTKQSFVELSKVEWSKYWTIFMFQACISFAMGVYYSSYGIYLRTQFGLTPKYIGYMVSVQGVIGTVSCFLIGYINSFYSHDDTYSIRNYHVFLLTTLSLLGICISYNLMLYSFLLIPLSIGNAIARLVTLELIVKRSHGDHRGTLIGASNSVRSLTGVVASMVGGLVMELFGVEYVMYPSFLSMLTGLVISYQYKNTCTHVKKD